MTSPNNQIAILACRQPEHAKIADFINCTASQPYNSRDMSSCDMSTGPGRAEIPLGVICVAYRGLNNFNVAVST